MTQIAPAPRHRAIVIGGSLDGLFAGNMLRLAKARRERAGAGRCSARP